MNEVDAIPLPSWRGVALETMEQFAALGAVRYSQGVLTDRDWNGTVRPKIWDAIVRFWDARGREIGYCTTFNSRHPHIFAPNYRQWHQMFLDAESFAAMPCLMDTP